MNINIRTGTRFLERDFGLFAYSFHYLIMIHQQPFEDDRHKHFYWNLQHTRHQRALSQQNTLVRRSQSNYNQQQQLKSITDNFRTELQDFIERTPGADFNTVLVHFKNVSFLDELAQMLNRHIIQENATLTQKAKVAQAHLNRLLDNADSRLEERRTQTKQQSRQNYTSSIKDFHVEIAKTLYEKARTCTFEEFADTFAHFNMSGNVKLTNIKSPSRIEISKEDDVLQIVRGAINQVRKSYTKPISKSSNQHIMSILRENFIGRKQKIEIVIKILSNDHILKFLEDMIENNGDLCNRPCCLRIKNQQIRCSTKLENTHYAGKRSVDNYYKGGKIDNFLEKFTNSMRERNAKQSDIRSISRSNLEATQNYEKLYKRKLEKKRKMQYLQRRQFDKTLLEFVKSKKALN